MELLLKDNENNHKEINKVACVLGNHERTLACNEKEETEICKIEEVNAKGYLISDCMPTSFFRI